jgi:AcrR family transcriptional regulator
MEVEVRTERSRRDRLLAAVIAHVESHGIGDLSLRELAAAIGTSHRMLIYHFGSKEGMVIALVHAVEAAQRTFLAQLFADPAVGPEEAVRTMWRRLADTGLHAQERLFFEMYGLALRGRPGTEGFLDGIVDSWVDVIADQAARQGIPPDAVRADARLSVAVTRGLLLDLLATGDREQVDGALERFIQLRFRGDPLGR